MDDLPIAISTPYLLFLGDSPHAKTAQGVRYWRPELCLAQMRYPQSRLDLGLPEMDIDEAVEAGAATLLIGAAPAGGGLPDHWVADLLRALDSGMDIASGLHARLNAIQPLADRAQALGRRLHDVRHPDAAFSIDGFEPRSGRRLLTVGTDCSVGKMYTALSLEREMKARGLAADFRATGQTGVLIAGGGVSIDAVVADFVAAAVAALSPSAPPGHWDVIEGQGSLFHPAYAGVTLALVHGSQADAMVLCSDPSRTRIAEFEHYPQPTIEECLDLYTRAARLTNPRAHFVGVSLNTSSLDEMEAAELMATISDRHNLPCVDPLRTGVGAIVDEIVAVPAELAV